MMLQTVDSNTGLHVETNHQGPITIGRKDLGFLGGPTQPSLAPFGRILSGLSLCSVCDGGWWRECRFSWDDWAHKGPLEASFTELLATARNPHITHRRAVYLSRGAKVWNILFTTSHTPDLMAFQQHIEDQDQDRSVSALEGDKRKWAVGQGDLLS